MGLYKKEIRKLITKIEQEYVNRAVEMRCIKCGALMINACSDMFENGYHIQLCYDCRDTEINNLLKIHKRQEAKHEHK